MTIRFPAGIDDTINLPDVVDLETAVSGPVINRLRDAIIAVESELGIKPSGVESTVRNRLDNFDITLQDLASRMIELAGDIGGTVSVPRIVGLQGYGINSAAPSVGQVLTFDGSEWIPQLPAVSGSSGVAWAGDLAGSTDVSQTVIKINGATVPAAGALTTNHVLKVSGASSTSYGYIVNANVDAAAAIAGTKISPNFGSQNVVTTGTIEGASFIVGTSLAIGDPSASAGTIRLPTDTKINSRNAGDSADYTLLHQIGGVLTVGCDADANNAVSTNIVHSTTITRLQSAANVLLRIGATNVADFSQTSSDYIALGASPAATGFIRLPFTNGTLLATKNSIATDIGIISQSNADELQFGSLSYVNNFVGATAYFRSTGGVYTGLFNASGWQFGGSTADFGAGVGVIGIDNAGTNPSTNPTAGIVAYVDAADGNLKYRKANGTVIALDGVGSGTPGGSDTQIQFNDGGAFGGDAGLTYNATTNVLSISDAVAVGAIVASAGAIRLPNTFEINRRNGADNADELIMKVTSDTIGIGGPATGTTGQFFSYLTLNAFAAANVNINGATKLSVDSNTVSMGGFTVNANSGIFNTGTFITMGSSAPSTAGIIRCESGAAQILSKRNAANNGNKAIIAVGTGDDMYIGSDNAGANIFDYVNIYSGFGTAFAVAGGVKASFAGNSSDHITLGSSPASAGVIRLANAGAIRARNAGDTGNFDLIRSDSSDYIWIGEEGSSTAMIFGGSGNFTFNHSGDYLFSIQANRIEHRQVPWIADSAGDHWYQFAVSNLAATRTITLPLLAGNDIFVFEAHNQTLTNKSMSGSANTFTNIPIGTAISGLGTGIGTWLATPSGENLATALTSSLSLSKVGAPTGTGVATVTSGAWDAASTGTSGTGNFARVDTPTFVTPILGAATGTSVVLSSHTAAGTNPATSGAFRGPNGTVLTSRNGVNGGNLIVVATDASDNTFLGHEAGTTVIQGALGGRAPHRNTMGLRLTLTTDVPVTTADVTAASTLYLTPYTSGDISLIDSTLNQWVRFDTNQISLSLSGLSTDTNYDVFAYWTGSVVALELTAWTNNTTRATALTRTAGTLMRSGSSGLRRYIGTIRTTGTTTTEDSATRRFVWNYYNQVERRIYKAVTKDSWSYTTAAFQQMDNDTANKVEYVSGDASMNVMAVVQGMASTATGLIGCAVGVGIDSTTVNSGHLNSNSMTIAGNYVFPRSEYYGAPGLGYHAINALEFGGTGQTRWGDAGSPTQFQSGIRGYLMG